MKTSISNLDEIEQQEEDTLDDSFENLYDFDLPLKIRFNSLLALSDKQRVENIKRLCGMYEFSGTTILKKFIVHCCTNFDYGEHNPLSTIILIEMAKCLIYGSNKLDASVLEPLNVVCKYTSSNIRKDTPTPCVVKGIFLLMRFEEYFKEANSYLGSVISNPFLECEYRYKIIISIENEKELIKKYKIFIKNAMKKFMDFDINYTSYRILAAQYLLVNYDLEKKDKTNILDTLLVIAQDNELDYNIRADSADLLIRLGDEQYVEHGRNIIHILAQLGGRPSTIFENAQNVHIVEIEDSMTETLEFLSSIPTHRNKKTGFDITIEGIITNIKSMVKPPEKENTDDDEKGEGEKGEGEKGEGEKGEDEKCEWCKTKINNNNLFCSPECKVKYSRYKKVNVALTRISLDRILYSKYNNTLSNILIKVWSYILDNKNRDEMKKRLLEELEEMAGTCSTGYASRLINSISGFGEFNMKISFKDQIVSNFRGRLNSKAQAISEPNSIFYKDVHVIGKEDDPDIIREKVEKFEEDVINEMTVRSDKHKERMNFLHFFGCSMLQIREEMYEEFKNHICDTDFDLYFRVAISSYEGCQSRV
jgi:hypothetical protein